MEADNRELKSICDRILDKISNYIGQEPISIPVIWFGFKRGMGSGMIPKMKLGNLRWKIDV